MNRDGHRSGWIFRRVALGHVGPRQAIVALAAIALLLAACGATATPRPSVSPAIAASPAPVTASAEGGLVAPTPEPAQRVHIPTVPCPTSLAVPGAMLQPVRTNMTATVTPALAALVTFYGNGALILLGPKGWNCTAAVRADGSAMMTITPPDQPAQSGIPSPDGQAVTGSASGSCIRCVALLACSLFPEALALAGPADRSCPTSLPAGELVTRPFPRSVVFEDPPGVAGTGEPSGGPYRALGLLIFDAGTPGNGTGHLGPSALKVTCALADAMAQICDELIEGPGQT
jgi:hypothetical protein